MGDWGVTFPGLLTRLLPFHEELVVHSTKWTTGSGLFLDFGLFPAGSWELVGHSSKWTTGSAIFLDLALFPAVS